MPKAVADEAEPPALCPAELSAAIDSVTAAPPFERARWGILVQPLASQRPLYSHNSEHYFIPASTVKLLTTAAALLELGSPFQMRTSVYGILSPTVTSLRVVGRGDPTLTTEQLQELAQQLQEQGIQRIKQLEVAEGYLGGPRLNPTWEWEDVYAYYGSAVNSLILNQNTFTLTLLPQQLGQPVKILGSDPVAMQQWRIDNQATTAPAGTTSGIEISGVLGQPVLTVAGELALDEPPDIWQLAIADPSRYFLETFRRLLMRSGIPVEQARITAVAGPPGVELAAVQSPPLAELIGEINRSSNNLFAEVLLQHLARRGDRFETIEQQLTALGVAPDSYVLADGSGLSRHNLVSPQALVQTLRLMAQTSEADSYRQSLAVAGVSGTLKRRFQNTALQGMQAKTGTLNGVAALAGYLTPPHYPPLAFSILLNQSHQPPAVQRAALDRIALLLGQLKEC
ncbi:MAG: D-alanyl-D-alanine carboxypeptidase/D-alanyl-D-alanine-endopeptidase [Cyanophyceae cyanobacterium]